MTEKEPADLIPDLTRPRRIHVVAAGGAGMSALATVLVQQGHHVTGSDQVQSEALKRLSDQGVQTFVGHAAEHVHGSEFLVVSTAVGAQNVELREAERLGIAILRRKDLLPALALLQPFISISGTHGKTTTSSLLTVALMGAGAHPSFLIGASVTSLGVAAAHQSGKHFVLEADESDGSFLAGPRAAALITNIEPDHLEFWGSWEELLEGFRRFLDATTGPRVVCADDPVAAGLGSEFGAVSYGLSEAASYRMTDLQLGSRSCSFTLLLPQSNNSAERAVEGISTDSPLLESVQQVSVQQVSVHLAVPGLHNATNAAGALALVAELGYPIQAAAEGLRSYSGVSRRFEQRGSAAGVQFVDDYAHLPTEVRAALAAGRSGDWNRVVAVFQPHRYSRTQALWQEFAEAFGDADLLVLTEIYPAGEEPRGGVTGRLLVDAVSAAHPDAKVVWCPELSEAATYLGAELVAGDLCMSIGAGDVTGIADLVLPILRGRAAS
ncbi:MAG: UDP-N-acetylmuramate--L-alanine ligase [Actinomycetes bacterium]